MSIRPIPPESGVGLRGPEGELVFVRLHVEPRTLEDILDLLASASFPVNPEIRHRQPESIVEFPAYDSNVEEIKGLLRAGGVGGCRIEVASALGAIR